MAGSFSSKTYNITALLGRTSFPESVAKPINVPTFQRSYSWEQSHVAALWDDISAFHKQLQSENPQDTYFLGPIVTLPVGDHVDLLDGQQRLATVTILLSVIRDLARQKGGQLGSDLARDIQRDLILVDDDSNSFSLTMNELDRDFFLTNVQEDPPSCRIKQTLRSHRLIERARSYLLRRVEEFTKDLDVIEFVATLKKLRITLASRISIVTIEVKSEDEAFLIFETLNDRGLRLAVPDLVLNHLMRTASSPADRRQIRNHWNNVIENLGQRKVSEFIRHMWISRYGDVKAQSLFREIRDNLAKQKVTSLQFAAMCDEESKRYARIVDLSLDTFPEDSRTFIEGLVRFLDADRALPVLLAGVSCLEPGDFTKLTRAIATVVTRHAVLSQLNPATLETALYLSARELRNTKNDGGSSAKALAAAKVALNSVNPTQSQLSSSIEGISLTKRQASYVVYTLAEFIQSQSKVFSLRTNSIEHILPEGAQKEDWPEMDDMTDLVWNIGNLTVMEPNLNRDAGDKSFMEKISLYRRSNIAMTATIPEHFQEWNRQAILDRSQQLLKVVSQVWPEMI